MTGVLRGILAGFLFLSCFAWAGSQEDLDLRTDYQLVPDPLTTEKIWKLDPGQLNPSLQRWVLERHSELLGMRAHRRAEKEFGVRADTVFSKSRGYLRGEGPWYQTIGEFPCTKEVQDEFATDEGTKIAIATAAEAWSQILRQNLTRLKILLGRVKAESEALALDRGNGVFRKWLRDVESEWRAKAPTKAGREEWSQYWQAARAQKLCIGKKKAALPELWKQIQEPVSGEPSKVTEILARAPVRLWSGIFTVRLDVNIAGKKLNGRFLVDSGAPRSVISPYWLENQGVQPAWVEIPGASAQPVILSHSRLNTRNLARPAQVDSIQLSGLEIPLNEFLLLETEFFSPPAYMGSCCDGVLGIDFLRTFPMEFKTTAPHELKVWPRENYHLAAENPWVELHESPSGGDLLSSCTVTPDGKKTPQLKGVRWETGNEAPLEVRGRTLPSSLWSMSCDSLQFASGVPMVSGKAGERRKGAVSAGMKFLQRGSFVFDIPHGKLWFSENTLKMGVSHPNRSGLVLEYRVRDGERELYVKQIRPKSAAISLLKAGLKPGMVITEIDSLDPADLDQWQVERRLAGDFGSSVSLQWEVKEGVKIAPLNLDQSELKDTTAKRKNPALTPKS